MFLAVGGVIISAIIWIVIIGFCGLVGVAAWEDRDRPPPRAVKPARHPNAMGAGEFIFLVLFGIPCGLLILAFLGCIFAAIGILLLEGYAAVAALL